MEYKTSDNLKKYAAKHGLVDLAKAAEISYTYMYQLAHDLRRPSPEVARAISEATNGSISLVDLRPDIWRPQ